MDHRNMADEHATHGSEHGGHPYRALTVSVGVSFLAMYAIMFSMADRWSHVYLNLSNVYMTGLMAVVMIPIMLLTMRSMFKNKRLNVAIWAGRGSCSLCFGDCFEPRLASGIDSSYGR